MNGKQKKLTGYPSIDKPWLKYYSEEAIKAKLPECTVYEYLWQNNKEFFDKTAINYFDRKITFGELFENIDRTAKAFTRLGLNKGDIIIMATVTTPETVYAFYALNRIGVIPNMVDPRTSTEGIREYISEVDAKVVLTIDVAYPKIKKAIEGKTKVESVLIVSPADSLPTVKKTLFWLGNKLKGKSIRFVENCKTWSEFLKNGKNVKIPELPYEKDSCCVIVHTGGTTGSPKAVMLSNDNLNAAASQSLNSPLLMKRGSILLNIMPPFIAYGMVLGIHTAFSAGWESVIIPKFEPTQLVELILKYRPNGMMGVPTYYEHLMSSPKLVDVDLSFIKVMLSGGDRTTAEFERRMNEFFVSHKTPIQLSKGYSMTEASSTATISFENANLIGCNGIPLKNTVIAAFEPGTDKELPYNEEGEICISTPTIMLGYYGREKETAEVVRKHSDGSFWVHSGDMGYVDENGFVFIDGRIKRLIIRFDGFKVFPTMIENVVAAHSAVETCCVVGMADKEHSQGKLPVVYVVVSNEDADKSQIEQELQELCTRELPEYAQPEEYRFVEDLPMTSIGKIDYQKLEEEASMKEKEDILCLMHQQEN